MCGLMKGAGMMSRKGVVERVKLALQIGVSLFTIFGSKLAVDILLITGILFKRDGCFLMPSVV